MRRETAYHHSGKLLAIGTAAAALAAFALTQHATVAEPGDDDTPCPEAITPEPHSDDELRGFAEERGDGVIYDDAESHLELTQEGGNFTGDATTLEDEFNALAAGDFNNNGWPDLIAGGSTGSFIRLYENRTYENPEPDWSDPDDIRDPNFVRANDIAPDGGLDGQHTAIIAGDFNHSGNDDFIYFRNEGAGDGHSPLLYHDVYLGNGDGTFQEPYDATENVEELGYMNWTSNNAAVVDWNGNGWPDILFGTKLGTEDDDGAVLVLLNDCPDEYEGDPCSRNPQFQPQEVLTDLDLGQRGANAIALADFNGNGIDDLLVGSPSYHQQRLYPGLEGGGFDEDFQAIESEGATSFLLAADFNLNGRVDFIYSTDNWNYNEGNGGRTFYFENDGTTTPFSEGATQEIPLPEGAEELGVALNDLDTGVVVDYDQDPSATPDIVVADGNHAGVFFVYANRVQEEYVECGEVDSGVLDLGEIQEEESVITGGRLSPDLHVPEGTEVEFYMANRDPPNWTRATPCADDASDYCASFDEPTGNDLQWKAVMCSDEDRSRSPTLGGVGVGYDYVLAQVHYRAGMVVDDGVAYAAGFSQPGQRGHFFALNADLTATFWDAGRRLDDMPDGDREVFTTDPEGAELIPFSESYASSEELQETLQVADAERAAEVIEWARSGRFGVDGTARLGAIESSTPAILSAPSRPVWYPGLSPEDQEAFDAFMALHDDRPTLALFGSRSGKIHAIRSNPLDIGGEESGREAWSFVPRRVASLLDRDRTEGEISTFPDGPPALADIRGPDGDFMTIAVVPGGRGSRSVVALDVTATIDRDTGEAIGPEPLWDAVPGRGDAGQARTSPVILRAEIDGAERFVAVLGSGIDRDDTDPDRERGRRVLAVDAATGEELWKLESACPITSDLSAFQSFDEADPEGDGEPTGFIDRLVVADECGHIYQVDPGADLDGGYIDTREHGLIATGATDPDGQPVEAVFSTALTEGALGGERPISGTIGVRPDATGRTVLFFGTGGLASFDPTQQNAFYAVYADDGEIRDVQEGECTPEGCEKFYGGVVVSRSQVFVTRSIDPPPGSGRCEEGGARVEAFDLNTLSSGFQVELASRSVGPLFAAGDAIYATTESGEVARVGEPSESAGDDEAVAREPVPIDRLAWRRLF